MKEASAADILKERVKELECLYAIARVLNRGEAPLDVLFQEVIDLLPAAFQYPESAGARIELDGRELKSAGFRPDGISLKAALPAGGGIQVTYPPEIVARDPAPFLSDECTLLEAVAADVSRALEKARAAEERERLERGLRHADRLSTLGTLATGVAHELNEPLSTILGFAQLVRKSPALPEEQARDVDRIVDASLRARGIVQSLLVFGGNPPAASVACDLCAVARAAARFLENRCRDAGITLRLELAEAGAALRADPAQLTQVAVNLMVNAVQAMPAGGVLTVAARAEGAEAVLVVEDTGMGMSAETLQRIFVPFFTTKGTRGGTGLGLPVVHGIVSARGGTIAVRSEVGRGSRFEVRIPAGGRP
jgi:two-component system, NtrC family, sensor kinase